MKIKLLFGERTSRKNDNLLYDAMLDPDITGLDVWACRESAKEERYAIAKMIMGGGFSGHFCMRIYSAYLPATDPNHNFSGQCYRSGCPVNLTFCVMGSEADRQFIVVWSGAFNSNNIGSMTEQIRHFILWNTRSILQCNILIFQ